MSSRPSLVLLSPRLTFLASSTDQLSASSSPQQSPIIFKHQQQPQQHDEVTVAHSLSHRQHREPEKPRALQQLDGQVKQQRRTRHEKFGFGVHHITAKQWKKEVKQNLEDTVRPSFLVSSLHGADTLPSFAAPAGEERRFRRSPRRA
jgi:hypothetical protein